MIQVKLLNETECGFSFDNIILKNIDTNEIVVLQCTNKEQGQKLYELLSECNNITKGE